MNILFAASEMVPFCKTGGLADVIGALPLMLKEMGHDVSVMLPGYSKIDKDKHGFYSIKCDLRIPVGKEMKPLDISSKDWKGITVYLLENDEYFSREGLYGDDGGDYDDNCQRFTFFSRGVLETAKLMGLMPDVIHTHDWQAGLVMAYFATVYANDAWFDSAVTLFTIHNLGYHGLFPAEQFELTGIPPEEFHWKKMEYWNNVSFLKSGIVYADAVSTVSETYAREITTEEMGAGLHGVLAERQSDLYGIVNGIDQKEWNPASDRHIPAGFGNRSMSGKKQCRKALLKACGLKAGKSVPVFGMVSRLDDQKGLDIIEKAVGRLMTINIRLVVLGTGSKKHHETMQRLESRYSDHIRVMLRFDNMMAHLIYAGSDVFLMPSGYEPCGLGQLIAMRYGTLPVVRATGGLADTVHDLNENPADGNGFTFTEYSSTALVDAVARAVKLFRAPRRMEWGRTVRRAMAKDYSWKKSAENYSKLYNLIRNRKQT
ncbi:glycogen synthase GlgA [Candidatus Latescibacterota bacterium]